MIEVTALTKRLGAATVLHDVSFRVDAGSVTGFLGANGAGKSTTMRCIAGLSSPTSGRATVMGRPYRELDNPARVMGVLLDGQVEVPGRTGREVLTWAARLMGVAPARVGEVLELVGLDDAAAKQRFGTYSLGMKQRLGIARALLGEPRILMLDEPANGLDPRGIRWLRDLLRQFADTGGAVLLSSHLLYEVQQIADHLVVIDAGRIVSSGASADLLAPGGSLEELYFSTTAAPAPGGEDTRQMAGDPR